MATMSDIARSAGVSTATVSYVLNNRERKNGTISPETRNRVLEVAAQLDYRANELARAVVTGKSRVLGLISDHNEGENKVRVFAGAVEAASEHGYLIKLLPFSPATAREALGKCRDWRLAGLMAANMDTDCVECFQSEVERLNLPIAMVDNMPTLTDAIHVMSDDFQGIGLVVQHLYDLGHRSIGFLGGYAPSPATQWRVESFRAHLLQRGLTPNEAWIRLSDWWKMPIIEAAAHEILTARQRPTAIVCAGDPIGMILVRVAHSLGLQVPRDLSITGYANFYLSEFANPALTTVEQPFREMGRRAVEMLISRAENPDQSSENSVSDELLPTRLLVRESSGPASDSHF